MKGFIPVFSCSNHGIEDGQEFAQTGDVGDLLGFSRSDKAVVEGFDDGIETNGRQRGRVKTTAYLCAPAVDGALATMGATDTTISRVMPPWLKYRHFYKRETRS
jgi:hypothetical protein